MTWLLAIPARIKGAIVALGLIVVALLTAKRHITKEAERDIKEAQHADTEERKEAGRDAVRDGRDSGLSLADRLRQNDGRW